MARTSSTSSRRPADLTSPHNERLEPRLLRAAESDDVEWIQKIVEEAKVKGQLKENDGKLLQIALMRSSEKGTIGVTQYLLEEGAKPDQGAENRLSPLLRAVERNHITIVQLLLKHKADPETADKKGRTALMTAAWKGHWHILNSLIAKGANVNARDKRRRNVLHNLAADKKQSPDWGDSVIELLLRQNIHIDGKDGQDDLRRSPLHWACATGRKRLAEQLLNRSRGPANINAVEIREKTALHIAAAHDRDDIVEMLLEHGANVKATSDGAWTPLHVACEKGTEKIVRILLEAGAEANAKLLNGMTPLHLAAQGGHLEVVECLLVCKDIKRAARDTFGITPFLRAAQNRRKDIVNLLAPFNQVEALSADARGACEGFNATIVDFGNFHNENQVKRRTVYDLLYGRDKDNPRKPAIAILPKESKATNFRWIHLPANNMAWVEALLTKAFIEEGAIDVEGFKALEKSFSQQHRGQQSHSHFMRPLCQTTPRAPRIGEEITVDSSLEQGLPAIVINGDEKPKNDSIPKAVVQGSAPKEDKTDAAKSSSNHGGREQIRTAHKDKVKKSNTNGKNPKGGTETPRKEFHRKSSYPWDGRHFRSPGSPGRREASQAAKGNIYTFMPYLHFETDQRRQEMQEAIRRAEILHFYPTVHSEISCDEMLIRAHLTSSTVSLHVRRTLDQSFYHNIDTQSRDRDQVVYRYQTKGKDLNDPAIDPKIIMVDQLWVWILGKDLIVTSFPQRWQQPKNDPLNVLDGVIEDINSKTREPVTSIYDLAMIITARCSGLLDRHRMGDEEYQFLDMFESSIGNATDRETVLFKEFNSASAQASAWLQHHQQPNRLSSFLRRRDDRESKGKDSTVDEDEHIQDLLRGRRFVDKLLDIGQETDLLAETKDIRDELNMIAKVLEDQRQVLPDLQAAICDVYLDEQRSQYELKKRFRDQLKTIEMHIKDIDRMDKQAERIYSSITDMLDLKQKHANAFEARFARDQAAVTARQSQTIMVFTIVTIIFLPLSFIAAFFTINIQEFPRVGAGGDLPLGYVSKYMFGIGFAVSIPLVIIALNLGDIGDFFAELRMRRRLRKKLGKAIVDTSGGSGGGALDILKINQAAALTLTRSTSTSKNVENNSILTHVLPRTSRDTSGTAGRREKITGFRMRISADVERGK